MPELPEVQTVVNDLQAITGDELTGFWTDWPKAFSLQPKEKIAFEAYFKRKIQGQKILTVRRVGKYIVLDLTDDMSILFHLRMTGQLLLNFKFKISNLKLESKKILSAHPHVHHFFKLKSGRILLFSDVRKFGTITFGSTKTLLEFKGFSQIGLDPTNPLFTLAALQKMLHLKEKSNLKDFLLNQSLISGIGNIYASEILFAAKISPYRKANSLSNKEISALFKAVKAILAKAIRMRGTSVSDYRDAKGQKGSFQKALKVYKKNGQPCPKCATIIEKSVISQRSTFYCPHCQK